MHRVYMEKMFLIIVIIMCFMSIIKLIFHSCYIDKIIKKMYILVLSEYNNSRNNFTVRMQNEKSLRNLCKTLRNSVIEIKTYLLLCNDRLAVD